MSSLYHIDGICLVHYTTGKRDEIFVNVVVEADSEVEAMMAVASDLICSQNCQSFVWQQLHVKLVKHHQVLGGRGERMPLKTASTPRGDVTAG